VQPEPAWIALETPEPGVDLWLVTLRPDEPLEAGELASLSVDERERHGRFHFARDARAFARRRAALRRLVAGRVGVEAGDVQFRCSERGRPSVAAPGPELNTSHSEGLALIAMSEGRRVGVDLERLRPVPGAASVARHYFAPQEEEALAAVSPGGRSEAFLRCWTRKEAYIKAVGDGLSMPLASFEVSVTGGRSLLVRPNPDDRRAWRLRDLPLPAGWVGALCVERSAG